jgi:hypothetical protein
MGSDCDLCTTFSPVEWDEERFKGITCANCGSPIVIFKQHYPILTVAEQGMVDEIVARRYPGRRRRGYMRGAAHWHEHLTPVEDKPCDLCSAAKDAVWSEGAFFGLICRTCGNPIIVLHDHRPIINAAEQAIVDALVERRYPGKRRRGYIRDEPRHWHEHVIE